MALDDQRQKPVPVPPVLPLTAEEEKMFADAQTRREIRLMLSGRAKPQQAEEIKNYFNNMVE